MRFDLGDGRICQGSSVGEDERRHGLITVVRLLNDCGRIWLLFDVDFIEGDALAIELRLKSAAVSAPWGRIHCEWRARHVGVSG